MYPVGLRRGKRPAVFARADAVARGASAFEEPALPKVPLRFPGVVLRVGFRMVAPKNRRNGSEFPF
jgi:hypothetical protein